MTVPPQSVPPPSQASSPAPSKAQLRRARDDDAGEIADVLLGSRAAFLPYAVSPHTDDAVRTWVRDVLLSSEDVTVATEADMLAKGRVTKGRVTGILAMKRHDGITWITQLYLRPSHVNLGIGSLLLSHALTTAARPIRLFTFQQNTGARRFYERSGFVPIRFTDGSDNEERCPDILLECR
jgi:GNAT superfamily N-acetyltransferase